MKILPIENRIRAISLWQPWAGAMALGIKKQETRSWITKVRGEVVICSTKKSVPKDLYPFSYGAFSDSFGVMDLKGYALCIVEIYDCIQINGSNKPTGSEFHWGDYTDGRYAWMTRNLRRIKPVPIKGGQGFFYLDKKIIEEE